MLAEEYLERVSKLDALINNKLIEVEQLYALLTSISVSADEDRVQSSGSKDKVGTIVPKIVELKGEINDLIDSYVDEKQDIIQTIEQLPGIEYNVLHRSYVQYKNLSEIAEELGYSVAGVKSVKNRALKHLQTILESTSTNIPK